MQGLQWKVETIQNRETGLLVALSDDLPGLYVHARSEEELEKRIPVAIKALLEAQGEKVGHIVKCPEGAGRENFRSRLSQYADETCYAEA